MTQLERNSTILKKYIPEQAVQAVAHWIVQLNFKLKIKKGRLTKYGDYRHPIKSLNHQITINQDLNKYAFFITLVHELAHLTNWNKYKHSVKPHGQEWKQEFQELMRPFLTEAIFPEDVMKGLTRYLQNPAASSCSDTQLMRTLKQYDNKPDIVLLEQLSFNSIFKTSNNRYFIKGEKRRKRFLCRELRTKRDYLFNPLAEVYSVDLLSP